MLRIVFIGSASLASPSLDMLCSRPEFTVVGVVTQPDRPAGRRMELTPCPLKETALQHHLPVFQPAKIRSPDAIAQIAYLKPDAIVVAAYGQILPKSILDLPPLGTFNVHASLLPAYRGAAPIQWALLDGKSVSGVTIMKVDEGLDTGDILLQEKVHIRRSENAQTLHDRLAASGAKLLVEALLKAQAGKLVPVAQPADSTTDYARKLTREDTHLDWTRPPLELWFKIRAFAPRPGAYAMMVSGMDRKSLKVFEVIISRRATGKPGEILRLDKHGILVAASKGGLLLREVQIEGKKRMPAAELINGNLLKVGDILQ
ncbi:MAG: methionyl-tRNA formyltransferase [Verrucomicrobiae bacterium]|nr:methionyl-tRNA formyltransferase [Verrucomicrobiae bacterium]